jgi:hypothetical protein
MMRASPGDDEKDETTDYTDFFVFSSCVSWIIFIGVKYKSGFMKDFNKVKSRK